MAPNEDITSAAPIKAATRHRHWFFSSADLLRRIERIGSLVSSIHAGAWSLAFPQPRTCLSTPALVKRLAAHGFRRRTGRQPENPACPNADPAFRASEILHMRKQMFVVSEPGRPISGRQRRSSPTKDTDNATHRHPPPDRRHRRRAAATTLLHRHARHAAGQEDRQPGRRQRLSPVLRRRRWRRPAPTSPSSTGRSRASGAARTASRAPGCASPASRRLDWWSSASRTQGVTHGDDRRARRPHDARLRGLRRASASAWSTTAARARRIPGTRSPVPAEHQIRGLGPITISVPDLAPTDVVLTRVMGMRPVREYADARRTRAHASTSTRWARAARPPSCMSRSSRTCPRRGQGAGGVHHVAFRTPDAEYAGLGGAAAERCGCRTAARSTASTSGASTSASRTASCSRSPPTGRASPSTSRWTTLGEKPGAAALPGGTPRGRSRRA